MDFQSEEQAMHGGPLAYGKMVDFGLLPLEEDCLEDLDARQKELIKQIDALNKEGNFSPPYMVIDMAHQDDIGLIVDGEKYVDKPEGKVLTPDAVSNPAVKILLPANSICDLSGIASDQHGGMSVVKCNPSVPVYRWFQAANLMLSYCDQIGRIIPFPMEQDDKQITYHMLRVDPREYMEYQKLLNFCIQQHGVELGFNTAAKYAYEVLSNRGYKELTAAQVDKFISHVMLNKGEMKGVLVLNAGRSEIDTEEMRNKRSIYY